GSYLVSAGFFVAHYSNPSLAALLLSTNGRGTVTKDVTNALAPYPNVVVQTRAQFEQAQVANVNQVLGLVRAVGMKRRQVRVMIRSEAVILAIFGAIIGIIVGTGMGIALVSSLKQQGITDTVVPASSLLIFLLLSALLGLVAASWPARRAAKLDVLAAIAAELCAHQGGSHGTEREHHRSFG